MIFDGESGESPQRKKAHEKGYQWKPNMDHQCLHERKSIDSRIMDVHDRHQHVDKIIK